MEERIKSIYNECWKIYKQYLETRDMAEWNRNMMHRQEKAPFIVRGLRAFSDFEYEFQRALLIKKIDNNLETVFIMTNANYSFLSSSGIRELATFGGCIHGLVPECVEDRIKSLVISKE